MAINAATTPSKYRRGLFYAMARTTSTQSSSMGDENILPAIATIQTNIEYMKKTLEEIRGEQKLASTLYLRLVEFESFKRDSEKRAVELENTLVEVRKEYATKDYVKPALTFTYTVLGVLGTALLGALATFIIRGGLK
jgi:hypothetical protein